MLDRNQVKAAASGRWEAIFRQLAPQLVPAIECSPRHAPECPMPDHAARGHDHGKGKFRFPHGWQENGNAICTCGHWSNGFDLLMAINRWTFAEVVQRVGASLGLAEDRIKVLATDTANPKSVQGKLLWMGLRRIPVNGKTITVYSVRVQPKNGGQTVVFSGSLLKKAVDVVGVKPGDNVSVTMTGLQTCQSSKGQFKRKVFAVTRLPSDEDLARAEKEAGEKRAECRRRIDAIWHDGRSLDATAPEADEVRQYFASRSLGSLPESSTRDLRAVAGMGYRMEDGSVARFNGLIGAVRDLDGNLVSVHRTFLKDGRKADVGTPKMLMALGPGDSIAGCAIHLGEPGTVLCLAEGIETAASVVIGTGYPCWSCVSANGLKAVKVPEKVKLVFIFEDKDRSQTGQQAAAELRKRLEGEGRIAVVCSISDDLPEGSHGLDWNDVLRQDNGITRFPVHRPQ